MTGGRGAVRVGMGILVLAVGGAVGWLAGGVGVAGAADAVAVLTEIRPGKGEVRVKRAGEADWTAPQPLLGLRPGDQVRVAGDGRVVLAFTGGGAQTVSAANSPFTVQAPRADSGSDRVRGLLAGVTQFLLGQQKEPTYQSLSVRSGGGAPPRILSPRATKLLPGSPTFEWTGPQAARYRVRLTGPAGVLWEQADLPRKAVAYPPTAPPLAPGTRYSWAVETPGQPVQEAPFEVLSAAEAARVQAALQDLGPSAVAQYPASTVSLMRAGLLFQEGLYADARLELAAAIVAEPDEPTLRLLLAYVYDRVGLREQAAQEFDEAEFLSAGRP